MKRKTKRRLIGLFLIFVGVIGGYLTFQNEVGILAIIISLIILITGFVLAGGGISDSWLSSD